MTTAQVKESYTDICYEDLIIEDNEPVDILSGKQQRLLAQTLYDSDHLPEPFLVTTNVGLFDDPAVPPMVPDVLVSLGSKTGDDILQKENHAYFMWKENKPPELVLEITSDDEDYETGSKFKRYAAMGVKYYVLVDHGHYIQDETLIVHELGDSGYVSREDYRLPELNLALTVWDGIYEQLSWSWVRWCTEDGDILLTGNERSERESQRAEEERQRAEEEKQRAEQAEMRAEQADERAKQEKQNAVQQAELAAFYLEKLREAGIVIDELK